MTKPGNNILTLMYTHTHKLLTVTGQDASRPVLGEPDQMLLVWNSKVHTMHITCLQNRVQALALPQRKAPQRKAWSQALEAPTISPNFDAHLHSGMCTCMHTLTHACAEGLAMWRVCNSHPCTAGPSFSLLVQELTQCGPLAERGEQRATALPPIDANDVVCAY